MVNAMAKPAGYMRAYRARRKANNGAPLGRGGNNSGRVLSSELRRGDLVFVPNFGAVNILGRARDGGYRAESAGTDWVGRRTRGTIQSSRFVGARVARDNRYYTIG